MVYGSAVGADRHALGRQPAEGAARPLAAPGSRGCCCSTIRPAASISAPALKLYEVFRGLARDDGMPLVVLSSEIEEVLQLCDRVLVFREQAVARELAGADLAMDRVIAAMFGQEVA